MRRTLAGKRQRAARSSTQRTPKPSSAQSTFPIPRIKQRKPISLSRSLGRPDGGRASLAPAGGLAVAPAQNTGAYRRVILTWIKYAFGAREPPGRAPPGAAGRLRAAAGSRTGGGMRKARPGARLVLGLQGVGRVSRSGRP